MAAGSEGQRLLRAGLIVDRLCSGWNGHAVAMTCIVVMRRSFTLIRRDLIAIPFEMAGRALSHSTALHRLGRMHGGSRPQDENKHQGAHQGKKTAHQRPP